MKFHPWTPKGKASPVRVYVEGFDGLSIGLNIKAKHLTISKKSSSESVSVIKFLESKDIFLNKYNTLSKLVDELDKLDLITKPRFNKKNKSKEVNVGKVEIALPRNSYIPEYRKRSLPELSAEASKFDLNKIKFLKKTLDQLLIEVDHREPDYILNTLKETGATVERKTLPEGDFRITLLNDDSREILCERKNCTDLSNSIMDQVNFRGHDQAERYSLYRKRRQSEGCYVGVFWILEYEDNATKTPFSCLPTTAGFDGWLNYLQAINGHQVIHSLNQHHTATLLLRISQGFFEKELRNKVVKGLSKERIDKTRSEREEIYDQFNENTGVTRPEQGLIGMLAALPGINTKVATSLTETGKSFSEISLLSVEDMVSLNGIGRKTAIHIRTLFHNTKN
jgi:ERCC4-type nuclease